METKQTAVDYLIQEIIPSSVLPIKYINEIISKAKAMEKEQIKDAFFIGDEDGYKRCYYHGNHNDIDFDEYYNETYGSSVDKK